MFKIITNHFIRIAQITYFTQNWANKETRLFISIYCGPGTMPSIFTVILRGPHNNQSMSVSWI